MNQLLLITLNNHKPLSQQLSFDSTKKAYFLHFELHQKRQKRTKYFFLFLFLRRLKKNRIEEFSSNAYKSSSTKKSANT